MNKLRSLFFYLVSCFILASCGSLPRGEFRTTHAAIPDYSLNENWAALPFLRDSADAVPLSIWKDEQDSASVDVFFIHPTTYTGRQKKAYWYADVQNEELNLITDRYPIRYQASLFNGAGKIYAPRYRQAHLDCFYTMEKEAVAALDLAYQDVRSAFEYYLTHYQDGRPFIIAAHSQGTYHASRLLKEVIEGKPIQEKLVVAYIPGLPIPADYFTSLKPCLTPDQTGCYCTWRTVRKGALPKKLHQRDKGIVVTNPVTWDATNTISRKEQHQGAILRDFSTLWPGLITTELHMDLLWVSKPKFPGSFLLMTKNYHIADYNFFYADVRSNAQQRARAYLAHH
jgi:hypothetical protein